MLASNPKFKNVPPNVLPKLARKLKEDSFARNWWQTPAGQAYRASNPGMTGVNVPPPTPGVSGPQAPQQNQPGPSTMKNVQQSISTSAPGAVNNAQNINPPPSQPAKNSLKRSSTDDLADASGQNGNFDQNQQAQNAEGSDKTQQAQMEAAMRNRSQPQPPPQLQLSNATTEEISRLQTIAREEHNRLQAQASNYPDIPMGPAELEQARQKLSQAAFLISNLMKAFFRWFHLVKNEERARRWFRTRSQLARQFKDNEKLTQQKDVLSITVADLDQIIAYLGAFKAEMAVAFRTAHGLGQVPQPAPEGPAPLNAANLEKQAQILKQAQNRAGNKAAQPPPPPTTTQPPFAFGAKKSPAGGPTYLNKPTVTADNLHLPPPRKKTKTGVQQTSSPATQQATVPSPQTKPPSPELKRQPPPEPVKPEAKTYPCPELDCESHQTPGFYSEEALQAHIQEEHVKPNEDPFRFVNENLAFALGLDKQGNSKMLPNGSAQDSQAAPPMSLSLSKQGQTPMSKPDFAATPMSRDASMRRQGSSAGTPDRSGIKSENTPRLADSKLPSARQESETPQMTVADDPWANSTIDPQNLFATFAPLETLPGSLASDMAMYRSLTPNDTPESSKDSGASEPNSDISEGMNLDIDLNWQPMDGEVLMHMANFNMEGFEPLDSEIMDDDNFQISSFDDMNDFSKPFHFDTSLYSMDPS